jgi:hypothetical protein
MSSELTRLRLESGPLGSKNAITLEDAEREALCEP